MLNKNILLNVLCTCLLIIACNNNQLSKNESIEKLSLQLKISKKEFKINEPVFIETTLINQSSDTILVTNRFLIGYEEQSDRDIYFKIFSNDNKRYDLPVDHQSDILPIAITQMNMQKLVPGTSLKKNIELTPVYRLRQFGKYKIVGVYEFKFFENKIEQNNQRVYSDTLQIEIVK